MPEIGGQKCNRNRPQCISMNYQFFYGKIDFSI
jgi:hypothetical protein